MLNTFRLKDGNLSIRVTDKNITHYTVPYGVTTIGYSAFSGCSALQSIDIPESVEFIWDSAFDGCSALQSINVAENNDHYTSIDGILFSKDLTSIIKYPIGKESKAYKIPDRVTEINNKAFEGCSTLQNIDIPNSVKTIGIRAFNCCFSLESIDIPHGVTSINKGVFSSCRSLQVVDIPCSVTSIDDSAFSFCKSLRYVDIPSSVTSIGMFAFNACHSLLAICIPDTITHISSRIFNECYALQDIIIPSSVMEIGGYAFYNCRSLKHIELSEDLLVIKPGAFSFCSALKSIDIPAKVRSIGGGAFNDCFSLESINVSKENRRFSSVDGILLDKKMTKIIRVPMGKRNVTFPNSVTTIGEYAFEECEALQSINIPHSVTTIEECAFMGCTSLHSIFIPNSITSIGNNIFKNCYSLQCIYLQSTNIKNINISEEAFESIGSNNWALHILQEPDCSCNDHPVLKKINNIKIGPVDDIKTVPVNNLLKLSKDGKTVTGVIDKNISSITIPNDVTTIAECAFMFCPYLQSVNIPDSVTEIGLGAFGVFTLKASLQNINVSNDNNYYKSVDGVLFNKDLTVIITFPRGKELEEYKIPSSVKTIGSAAFWCCTYLRNMHIPDGVMVIQDSVFGYCTSLQNVDIPNSVTEIREGVFESCTALRSIHMHIVDLENVTINQTAFDGIDKDNCVLYIPPGTRWAYRHHSVLGKFKNIEIMR